MTRFTYVVCVLVFVACSLQPPKTVTDTSASVASYSDQCMEYYAGEEDEFIKQYERVAGTLKDFCGCYDKHLSGADESVQSMHRHVLQSVIEMRRNGLTLEEVENRARAAWRENTDDYPITRETMRQFRQFNRTIHSRVAKGNFCVSSDDPVIAMHQDMCSALMSSDPAEQDWLADTGQVTDGFCRCYGATSTGLSLHQQSTRKALMQELIDRVQNRDQSVNEAIEDILETSSSLKRVNSVPSERIQALFDFMNLGTELSTGAICPIEHQEQ